eukprot:260761_1
MVQDAWYFEIFEANSKEKHHSERKIIETKENNLFGFLCLALANSAFIANIYLYLWIKNMCTVVSFVRCSVFNSVSYFCLCSESDCILYCMYCHLRCVYIPLILYFHLRHKYLYIIYVVINEKKKKICR